MQVEFALVLGRLIASLRHVYDFTQKGLAARSKEKGSVQSLASRALMSTAGLSWIESGRSQASAPQLWNLEEAFKEMKTPLRPIRESGDLFRLLGRVLEALKREGWVFLPGRRERAPANHVQAQIDLVCGQVVRERLSELSRNG